jgi:hypothetical protein
VRRRSISSTLRPVVIGYQLMARMMPSGSITKMARTMDASGAFGAIMP